MSTSGNNLDRVREHIELAVMTNTNIDISSSPKVAVCCAKLRWTFIIKVYGILCLQFFLTLVVASSVALFHPLNLFFLHTTAGIVFYIITALIPFALLWPMYLYHKHQTINLLLLILSTVSFACALGVSCTMEEAGVVLEGVVLMTAVVVSLCLYTLWAAKRGHDNGFWYPFLCCVPVVLAVFAAFQEIYGLWVWPVDKKLLAMRLGSLFFGILFSAALIFNTNKMIRRCSLHDLIWAASSIHLDVFAYLITISRNFICKFLTR